MRFRIRVRNRVYVGIQAITRVRFVIVRVNIKVMAMSLVGAMPRVSLQLITLEEGIC